MIKRSDSIARRRNRREIRHTPRLVERHPDHDARMTRVALDRFRPLAHEAVDRFVREAIGARHLFPDQQAEHIGPIQITWIFDLLMFTDAVEPHSFASSTSLRNASSDGAVMNVSRPIPLIEHQSHRERPAIQHQSLALRADGAQRRVRREFVDHVTPAHQCTYARRSASAAPATIATRYEVIDAWIGQADAPMHLVTDDLIDVLSKHWMPQRKLDRQREIFSIAAADERVQSELPAFQVRRPLNALHVDIWDAFEPHRLPDARRARIPDAVRLEPPILFAARLLQVMRIVFHANRDALLAARCQAPRDVRAERRVATFVLDDRNIVDPDRA